jgi:DNA helicase II / ATP-dependent DNA helicase PcrA
MVGITTFTENVGVRNMSKNLHLAECRPIGHDDGVDEEIKRCLSIGSGKSFITFAGAGSGKTYSLKKALDFLKEKHSTEFSKKGKQIAVVTFTNNAADEIQDRVEKSPVFKISTIHSFCWASISGFNEDIRKWFLAKIPVDLADLEEKERNGRAGKASDARKRSINRLTEKMEWLSEPRSFIYDPNGVNSSPNSLSHADVLKIFAEFLAAKPMMAEVIVNKFPFIFIDESQDTNKEVVNAFFDLRVAKSDKVVIGLMGDSMQRIFGGGEPDLGVNKPLGWTSFDKEMNHRSARRIVGLGNQIRSEDDKRQQFAREGALEGVVRFFLLSHGVADKEAIEVQIRASMAQVSDDAAWNDADDDDTAILLLEHKMVGRRLGFSALWDCLSKAEKIKDRISEGDNTELNFFSSIVLPMAEASLNNRRAELMSILRERKSGLLEPHIFESNKHDPLIVARSAEHAFKAVVSNPKVRFREVLEVIAEYNLVPIPSKLRAFVPTAAEGETTIDADFGELDLDFEPLAPEDPPDDSEIAAWADALETEFFQTRHYQSYIDESSPFRTHQGVKGNEFERVMVVMDDDEAGGFLFSYEQYFGVKDLSSGSKKKRDAGEETGLDRTRRLFYVTSTRAKSSLAHVIYTSDPKKLQANLIERKFAMENEIVIVDPH